MDVEVLAALASVRDIEGVIGSFLIDAHGRVLARDLPAWFGPEALARAGVHLARLREAFESDGGSFDGCVARFGAHVLLLRSAQLATLCVLCPRSINLPAVQMSATLLVRHLGAAGLLAGVRAAVAETGTSPRQFRGRPV